MRGRQQPTGFQLEKAFPGTKPWASWGDTSHAPHRQVNAVTSNHTVSRRKVCIAVSSLLIAGLVLVFFASSAHRLFFDGRTPSSSRHDSNKNIRMLVKPLSDRRTGNVQQQVTAANPAASTSTRHRELGGTNPIIEPRQAATTRPPPASSSCSSPLPSPLPSKSPPPLSLPSGTAAKAPETEHPFKPAPGSIYNDTHRPPFAWVSPEWEKQHARLLPHLKAGDYHGLHGVPLPRLDHVVQPNSSDVGDGTELAYHLVLTSCYRPHWGRYLTTTLLHIWLQGATPTTLTVLWCHPYNASKPMPSLIYNLRHSTTFRLLHVPPASSGMPLHPTTTYLWALTVPDYYGYPDLPLLIMEDDAVMMPNFGLKLASAVHTVSRVASGPKFVLNLYNPAARVDVATRMLDPLRYNTSTRATFRHTPAAAELAAAAEHSGIRRGHAAWGYGVQGQLFSPSMRRDVLRHFWEVLSKRFWNPGFQDMILHEYVYKRRPEMRLAVFGVTPSLLDHTGASSGVFGGVSERYHMSRDYPYHVLVPFFDPDEAW